MILPAKKIYPNHREVLGLNFSTRMLLRMAGEDIDLADQIETLLTWVPFAGTDYLIT